MSLQLGFSKKDIKAENLTSEVSSGVAQDLLWSDTYDWNQVTPLSTFR